MRSFLADDFLRLFGGLPLEVQEKARKDYRIWRENPHHPGLRFKRVHRTEPMYSVRIGIGWRALGLKEGDAIYWFWIGSHKDYEMLLSSGK